MQDLLIWFDLIGTLVFAISGALAAGRKDLDIFGVVVLAMVTAVGGGTLRDVILGLQPVFWVQQSGYLTLIIITAIATVYLHKTGLIERRWLLYADALGLATFTIIGFDRVFAATAQYEIAILMAVMTAVAGGVIRDVLSGEIPLILRQEIYASACFFGASLYALLLYLQLWPQFSAAIAMLFILLLRLAALHWSLSLPVFSSQTYKD